MSQNQVWTWDEAFMVMTYTIAQRSKDPSTKVGALIVSPDNRIRGVGYNGMPQGNDQFPWSRPEKYNFVLHAEENAVLNADGGVASLRGCRIYCNYFSCHHCSAIIAQVGINEIIYCEDGRHRSQDAEHIHALCNIVTRKMEIPEAVKKMLGL